MKPLRVVFAVLTPSLALTAWACSLGLDASKIPGEAIDAALPETSPPDVAPQADASGTYKTCTTTGDCPTPNACASPRCDDVRKVCVYDQCPTTQTCAAIACDPTALTCAAAPSSYGFHAAAIHLPPGAIGCNGVAARCFAASYPFVFVGTATGGILAYSVANPGNATPPPVTVDGVGFAPAFLVASGNRVWFLGNRVLAGAGYQQPVAYLDVPTDPTVKHVTAVSTLVQTSNTNVLSVLPTDNGGALVLLDEQGVPSTRLDAPLAPNAQLLFYPLGGLPTGAEIATSSGARLVTHRVAGSATAPKSFFSLEGAAGTVSSQNAGEQDLTAAIGAVYTSTSFASSPLGAVAAMVPVASVVDGGVTGVSALRVHFLLATGQTTSFDGAAKVDVETYATVTGPQALGGLAWADEDRLIALAGGKADGGTNTVVHVVKKTPAPALGGERYVLPADPSRYVVTGSHGFGYVLGSDTPAGDNFIHVFAPGCP